MVPFLVRPYIISNENKTVKDKGAPTSRPDLGLINPSIRSRSGAHFLK